VKLEDAERRYADRVLEDFTSTDPGFIAMSREYEERRAHTAVGQGGDRLVMSPLEAAQQLGRMNAYVRSRTGVTTDLFDFKEMRGEVRSMADLVVSAYKRAQSRTWELEDRAYARDTRRLEREAENRETAQAAGMAWAAGDVEGAIAGVGSGGVDRKHFDRLALRDFRNGNLDGLARAFRVGHFVSETVKKEVAAGVEGTLDQQYGSGFKAAHERWTAMYKANPGMTRAYYGEWHEKMRYFTTLFPQLGPESAYTRAFGDSKRYSGATLPAATRKEAETAIASAVAERQPSWWNPWGGPTFTAGAVGVMQNVLRERVAMGLQNSDTPPGMIAKEALDAALADGSLQVAGGQAWRAAPGTKPFRVRIGLQQDEADEVFDSVVDDRLKRAGLQVGTAAHFKPGKALSNSVFDANTQAHLDINYVQTPKGADALYVVGRDEDGNRRGVIIGLDEFRAAARRRTRSEVAGSQPTPAQFQARKSVRAGLDPHRRIPSEKPWQRITRINLEFAAGAKPHTGHRR
jgi:hypothetical protein